MNFIRNSIISKFILYGIKGDTVLLLLKTIQTSFFILTNLPFDVGLFTGLSLLGRRTSTQGMLFTLNALKSLRCLLFRQSKLSKGFSVELFYVVRDCAYSYRVEKSELKD